MSNSSEGWRETMADPVKMLVAALLFISFTALAKDAAPKSGTKIEASSTNKSSDAKQPPLQLPLPVRIVEEPPESDDAKYRADHTSSNEDQDLQAQQSMASSAEWQLIATCVAVGLSFVGTFLLIWTVFETRKTANAAWRSVHIADQGIIIAMETAEKQLRAYINVSSARISNDGNAQTVRLTIKNFGQTPAKKIVVLADMTVGDLHWQSASTLKETTNVQQVEGGVIGPTAAWTMQVLIPLLADAGHDMEERKKAFYFWGEISYNDAFDHHHITKFRLMITGEEWFTNTKMGVCHQGNDAT